MWQKIFVYIVIVTLTGCSFKREQNAAPVVDMNNYQSTPAAFHVVAKGESLYAIAWRYGRDYREIAKINNISSPYRIYPRQKIFLKNHITPIKNQISRNTIKERKPTLLVEFPKQNTNPIKSSQDTTSFSSPLNESWQWPVKGKIIKPFSQKDLGPKGIDIAGKWGDKIKAAGSGKVVYSGSGLRGYGQLIIIKHNETYLSAYGHNSRLLVKEGEMIHIGQDIAEMGTDGTHNKLHFEIRKNGLPVDPLSILSG